MSPHAPPLPRPPGAPRPDGHPPRWSLISTVAADRRPLFGQVIRERMHLNVLGQIVLEEWSRAAYLRPWLVLDAFVIMPDHVHGLLSWAEAPVTPSTVRERFACSLGAFVGGFKAATARRIRLTRLLPPGAAIWARGYEERVIHRSERLERVRRYLANEPVRWLGRREGGRA